MKKGPLVIVLALALAACSILGEPVDLAVRTDIFTPHCHTSSTIGMLIPDEEAGTAIVEDGSSGDRTLPVLWPEGFSARRFGNVVEVLNQDGTVIARTGGHYRFEGGYDEAGWRGCDGVIPMPR